MSDVPQGYLPPISAYQPVFEAGADPNDPLVNPPHAGINGWFSRISGMFKRSWKTMAAIFAVTYLLPYLGLAVIAGVGSFLVLTRIMADLPNQDRSRSTPNTDILAIGIPILLLIVLVAIIIFVILQMAGYAAATYAVTRQAIGQQVRLGEALGYGFRRAFGLAGWQILVTLLVILGAIACILPGFYVYAATALFGPIYLFERRSPIGRSFSIFNNNLGRVLGRLALLLAATVAAGVANSIISQIGSLATGNIGNMSNSTVELSAAVASTLISSVLGIIIQLPLTMLTFAGILLTYTEQRGYEGPVNSATLAAEL